MQSFKVNVINALMMAKTNWDKQKYETIVKFVMLQRKSKNARVVLKNSNIKETFATYAGAGTRKRTSL